MMNLFMNDNQRGLFFLFNEEPLKCRCSRIIGFGDLLKVVRFFNGQHQKEIILCSFCHPKKGDNTVLASCVEEREARLVEVIPTGCTFIPPAQPMLKDSTSTVQAAYSNSRINAETTTTTTIDRTILAHRESWEGAQIGDPEIMRKIEKKDRNLKTSEIGGFLTSLQNMKPTIIHTKRKLLEADSHG